MKRIKIFSLFLLLSVYLQAAVINVTNPGNNNDIGPNIIAAHTAAFNGDVLQLPTGIFKVGTTLINITKLVSLKGNGYTNTILYRDAALSDASIQDLPMIRYTTNSRTLCGIDISGIEFRSKDPGAGSLARDIGVEVINAVGVRIYNCKFTWFGNAGLMIRHYDDIPLGVAYNNIFLKNTKGPTGLGYGYGIVVYGQSVKWIDDPDLGGGNKFFIENNQFYDHRHSISLAGCSNVNIRYNYFQNNKIAQATWQCIDGGHQARENTTGTNRNGSRVTEILHNKINNTMRIDSSVALANGCPDDKIEERGIGAFNGETVISFDTVYGCRFPVGLNQNESTTYPYPYIQQCGAKSGKREGRNGGSGTYLYTAEGDTWISNMVSNSFTLTGGGYCQSVWNYSAAIYGGLGVSTDYISNSRDMKIGQLPPLYTEYTYPHPLRTMNNKN